MSLIDMTQFARMDVYPEPDGHTGGRDEACDGDEGELAARGSPRCEVAAWIARSRRAAADIDRVRVLARTHEGGPDWGEVDALLDRLGIALGRDHGPPGAPR